LADAYSDLPASCVSVSVDWADIAFHYLLDSEGYVYEARDARAVPSAVHGYGSCVLCCQAVRMMQCFVAVLSELSPHSPDAADEYFQSSVRKAPDSKQLNS